MPMYKNGVWYLEYVIDGRRYLQRTEHTSTAKAVAEKVRRLQQEARAAKKAELRELEARRVRNRKGKIIDQPISEVFIAYYEARGKDAKGKGPSNIIRELSYVENFFGPQFMLGDIDAEELIRLREHRRRDLSKTSKAERPVSNRTVNITLESVRWVLGWAERNGREVAKIDWSIVKLPNNPRSTEYRYEHHNTMLTEMRQDYVPIILFLVATGCRRREATSLRWEDIDLRRRTVALMRQKREAGVTNDVPHLIPLTAEIEAIINTQIDHVTGKPYHPVFVFTFIADRSRRYASTGKTFVAGRRYPIGYEGLGTQWARFKMTHRLENVRLHDIRHAAAARTLDLTRDLTKVRDLLGHSNISTTERYLPFLTVEGLRSALEKSDASACEKTPTESPTEEFA